MNDLLALPLRGPAIYNPDLLSKDELIRGFVARQDLLRFFVEELRRVAEGGGVQHHLLLGQRGMGKTTLLRRIRHAVDDDPVLREAWLPLTFPEEQYDVADLSDFYLNCIDALSDALESRGKVEAARALDAAVAAIPRKPESARAHRALELLVRTATRRRARLLLLLDNIDLLLHRLSEHHWTLRELLSSQDRLCIIGASAAAIETTYDYGRAFYDFFRVHPLGGLSDAECREVLLALSRMFGTPQVEAWVNKEPGRLRALRLLTGGNPRTVALLHTVAASSEGGDVRTDLERLLDQCTALYKHRFESLPDQAQRVVHALALRWQPASAADIAEATRLEINAVSSQLARLVSDGVVEKVPFFPETKTGFQVAERFFNIWYLMRSSRRVRRRLVWLVEFLKMFYEGEDLQAHARRTLRGAKFDHGVDAAIRHAESTLAFAEAVSDETLRKALEASAAHALTALPEVREKIGAIVDIEGADAPLKPVLDRHKASAEVRERVLSARVSVEGWNAGEFADLLGGSLSLSPSEKKRIADELEKLNEVQLRDLLRIWREEVESFEHLFGPTVTRLLQHALRLGYVEDVNDLDTVRAAAMALDAPLLQAYSIAHQRLVFKGTSAADALGAMLPEDEMPYGWEAYGVLLLDEGRRDRAEQAFRKAISLDDEFGDSQMRLARLLAEDDHRLDEAESAFLAAAACASAGRPERHATAASRWRSVAGFLLRRRNKHEEAADAYQRSLAIEPEHAGSWNRLGAALLVAGKLEEAERAYRRATELEGSHPMYWYDLGRTLRALSRLSEAETALHQVVGLDAGSAPAWRLLSSVLADQGRLAEAANASRAWAEIAPREGQAWNALAWDLYCCGEVGAEVEHAAREGIRLAPENMAAVHTAATILARRGHWPEARDLARRFLRDGPPDWHAETWEEILLFFREAVAAGHAADAGALLDEADLGERWLPLREALRILGANNPLLLRKLAPEVREPARLLMERLAPSASASPAAETGEVARARSAKSGSPRRTKRNAPPPGTRPHEVPPRESNPRRGRKSP